MDIGPEYFLFMKSLLYCQKPRYRDGTRVGGPFLLQSRALESWKLSVVSQDEAPAAREEAIKADPPVEPQVPITANGDATEEIVEKKKKKVSFFSSWCTAQCCYLHRLLVFASACVIRSGKSVSLQELKKVFP